MDMQSNVEKCEKSGLKRLLGRRIMVVDDCPDSRMITSCRLKAEGASVEVVGSGEAAVDLGAREGFDAIIMDLELPGIDGFETVSLLRHRGYAAPIVALTAHTDRRVECLHAGFDEFATKSVSGRELIETMGRLCSWKNVLIAPSPLSKREDSQEPH